MATSSHRTQLELILIAALVGNLGGLSSFLLSLDGGALAARQHLDVLIPVRGYRRALNTNSGYGAHTTKSFFPEF